MNEDESLYPYKGRECKCPPLALKLAYSHGLCKRHSWVTHARIDENPAMRGHDLCFDKMCQWQPRLETWSGRRKTVRNYDRTDVMSCYKKLSADWIREILYSLYGCVWCVCYRSGHIDTSEDYFGYSSEGGTRLAMPKTYLRAGYFVIEARFKGY